MESDVFERMKFDYLIALGHVKSSGFMRPRTHNETYDNGWRLESYDKATMALRETVVSQGRQSMNEER